MGGLLAGLEKGKHSSETSGPSGTVWSNRTFCNNGNILYLHHPIWYSLAMSLELGLRRAQTRKGLLPLLRVMHISSPLRIGRMQVSSSRKIHIQKNVQTTSGASGTP